ncbi:hypothetical protein BGZ76_001147 [Entomortierella beljakovae]|nr:hypothetical protein BGZ76_001147 [Entomortierella beljakovae]
MAHPVSHRVPPGGVSNMTVIDSHHPLAKDSELAVILESQKTTILETYAKAKGISLEATKGISFEPVGYSTQVVAGTNYYVKLHVTGGSNDKSGQEYVHVTIYSRPWENVVQLTNLAIDKHLLSEF